MGHSRSKRERARLACSVEFVSHLFCVLCVLRLTGNCICPAVLQDKQTGHQLLAALNLRASLRCSVSV